MRLVSLSQPELREVIQLAKALNEAEPPTGAVLSSREVAEQAMRPPSREWRALATRLTVMPAPARDELWALMRLGRGDEDDFDLLMTLVPPSADESVGDILGKRKFLPGYLEDGWSVLRGGGRKHEMTDDDAMEDDE